MMYIDILKNCEKLIVKMCYVEIWTKNIINDIKYLHSVLMAWFKIAFFIYKNSS